jgi:N-acylneuraminate cytidylyltransferase
VNIGFIPARSGSKRVIGKNSRDFFGKPLFTHALDSAIESGAFDDIFVSSDSEDILKIAQKFGASTVVRSPALANDTATISEVVRDFLTVNLYSEKNVDFCCILPSNPFVTPSNLKLGLTYIDEWDFVLPVHKYIKPIERALKRDETGLTKMKIPSHVNTRTQDLEDFYYDAGQFYWAKKTIWLEKSNILDARNFGIILDPYSSVDIDDETDWNLAELIYSQNLRIN